MEYEGEIAHIYNHVMHKTMSDKWNMTEGICHKPVQQRFHKKKLKVKQNKNKTNKKESDSDLKLQQRKKGLNPW